MAVLPWPGVIFQRHWLQGRGLYMVGVHVAHGPGACICHSSRMCSSRVHRHVLDQLTVQLMLIIVCCMCSCRGFAGTLTLLAFTVCVRHVPAQHMPAAMLMTASGLCPDMTRMHAHSPCRTCTQLELSALRSLRPFTLPCHRFTSTPPLLHTTCVALQVGEFIMVALGFALPSWQHLLIACASINAAALLLYPLVSESARWLLSQGRTEQAKAVLQQIARVNKSSMPAQPLVVSRSRAQLQMMPTDTAGTAGAHAGTSTSADAAAEEGVSVSTGTAAGHLSGAQERADVGLWQLLKQRQFAARLFVLLVNWFGLMLNYYGISMGAGGIPGSM